MLLIDEIQISVIYFQNFIKNRNFLFPCVTFKRHFIYYLEKERKRKFYNNSYSTNFHRKYLDSCSISSVYQFCKVFCVVKICVKKII